MLLARALAGRAGAARIVATGSVLAVDRKARRVRCVGIWLAYVMKLVLFAGDKSDHHSAGKVPLFEFTLWTQGLSQNWQVGISPLANWVAKGHRGGAIHDFQGLTPGEPEGR